MTTSRPKVTRDRATEIQAEALRNGGWPENEDDLDAEGFGPDDPSTDAVRHPANRPDADRRRQSNDPTRRQAAAIIGTDEDRRPVSGAMPHEQDRSVS